MLDHQQPSALHGCLIICHYATVNTRVVCRRHTFSIQCSMVASTLARYCASCGIFSATAANTCCDAASTLDRASGSTSRPTRPVVSFSPLQGSTMMRWLAQLGGHLVMHVSKNLHRTCTSGNSDRTYVLASARCTVYKGLQPARSPCAALCKERRACAKWLRVLQAEAPCSEGCAQRLQHAECHCVSGARVVLCVASTAALCWA